MAFLCILGFGLAASAQSSVSRDVIACSRPPTIPESIHLWVVAGGTVYYKEPWLFTKSVPKGATTYVLRPDHSICRKGQSITKPKATGAPAASPSAPTNASRAEEVGRQKKEAEAREASERAKKEAKARDQAAKEQADKKAREAAREREHREKQAQLSEEERHREREREQPQVLPRKGVSAAWPNKVLKEAKSEGVTVAWPTKVLPNVNDVHRSAPMATVCAASPARAPNHAKAKVEPATMALRKPILDALLALEAAKNGDQRMARRRALRELFERIAASQRPAFLAMLASQDALGVTFQRVLKADPLKNELLGIHNEEPTPDPSQCSASALLDASPASAPDSMILPIVSLTDEEAFDKLHAQLKQKATEMREACESMTQDNLGGTKKTLLELMSLYDDMLVVAKKARTSAFKEIEATKRAAAIKAAGVIYSSLIVLDPAWSLYINFAVLTDAADRLGVPSAPDRFRFDGLSPLNQRLRAFENDKAYIALYEAALRGDVPAMIAAQPAANVAFERHSQRFADWRVLVENGAYWSKKVIQVADMTMLAITIYQVWKMPGLLADGSPRPPTITGFLPGGVALGSRVNPVSLANAVESIRRLVQSGALDGALVAGVSKLGGGPGLSMPELQRPTSLSVQQSNPPGGSSPGSGGNAGGSPAAQGGAPGPGGSQGYSSFDAFKRAMGPAGPGKHWHHMVEQTPANVAKFGPQALHNTKNVIPLNSELHVKISGFYSSIQRKITGSTSLTVRQWLSTQSYAAQEAFGELAMQNMSKGVWP